MAPEDVQEAQVKLDGLIAEGVAAFNEGKTDEALAIAESAIASNPSSIAALSLMADCRARRGELAEALEYAEKIVELNPDSELDKIRRNQLRSQLVTSLRVPDGPDRRLALLAAVSAVVLVVCLGAVVAKLPNKSAPTSLVAQGTPSVSTPSVTNVVTPPATTTTANPPEKPPATNEPDAAAPTPQPGEVPPVRDAPSSEESHGTGLPPAPTGRLPIADGSGDVVVVPEGGGNKPFDPGVSGTIGRTSDVPKPSHNSVDPPPAADPGPAAAAKAPDDGEISISLHSGSAGPGASSIDGNGVEALVRTGTQQYLLNNYSAAATSFERALRNGGDAISLNQRLADSYEKLGRNSEAAAAYGRAIEACRSALGSGKGNKDRIQSVMNTCTQALKVLQGG